MDTLVNANSKFTSRELQIKVNKYGIITEITSNCFDILGCSDTEILNTNISNYLNYTFDDLVLNENFNVEISMKNGVKRFLDIHTTPLIVNNTTESIYLSIIDVSRYKESENKGNMLFKMIEHSKDIVCRVELIPNRKYTYLSPSVEDILGYKLEEHLKNPFLPFEIVHPDDYEAQLSKVQDDTDFSKLIQVRMKHKDGYYVWLEDYIIPTYNENGQLIVIESICRNIQQKKELEQRLEKIGYHDDLTGLFNKNYLLKEIDLLNNSINAPVGILVCDLDNLKCINDSLGHISGDELIKATGKILQSVFNRGYVVSRTGGDEFVVIVKNKSYIEVESLYNNLQTAIQHYNTNNSYIPIEISIGLAFSETSLNTIESTLDIADSNMYREKKQKKQVLY